MKLRKQALKYNLQFFADAGAGDGGAGADGGNGGNGGDGQGADGDSQTQSFDDVLKTNNYQSEFDKRIAKALETAKGNWKKQYEADIQAAKTEAEKLAKMNAEQKAKYEQDKRLAELEKRERDITVRELKAQANLTLTEKGLPTELSEILNYESADTCNASIEAVQKAFQSAVEKAVNDKLRGSGAPKGNLGNKMNSTYADLVKNADSMTAEQVAAMWNRKK